MYLTRDTWPTLNTVSGFMLQMLIDNLRDRNYTGVARLILATNYEFQQEFRTRVSRELGDWVLNILDNEVRRLQSDFKRKAG
jgi:hypothetical protein